MTSGTGEEGFGAQSQSHPGDARKMDPPPDHGESSYRGHDRLTGKRAVVTGGDSGIGRAVAIAFAREGADVLNNYPPEEQEEAESTADLIRAAGRTAVAVAGDVRDEAFCHRIVDTAVAELGGLDVLVINAAYQMEQEGGIADISSDQLRRVFETNVYALFWLTQAALPHLKSGASIITTSSIQAYDPSPGLLDYAASKAAIRNATQGLAQQLGPQGIRVNTVAPGPVWTPLIPATMPEEHVKEFGTTTPLGRAAQPVELAPAYVFLASDEASYITGERLGVAGGSLMP
jgi:NAD(P)-dependent dehydrogenase (short-subunit alcohol dehydrogenase family)